MISEYQYVLAPMAEYTDLPFRRTCRKYGLRLAHTALIDSGALVHANPENSHILARGPEEDYLAVQLLGSLPEDVKKAAAMLNRMNFDAVDFNMGCPVRKVQQRKAGAALMRHPELALECLKLVRDEIDGPLTVKTRILSEEDPEPTVRFCRQLESVGIQGITIHGRLASRIYSGPVAVDVIREIRNSLAIPVTANGGIFHREDAEYLGRATGCNRLMVARGAIGNPWIFRELIDGVRIPPEHEELCQLMRSHLLDMMKLYGEKKGMIKGRKIILSYLVGRGYRRSLRAQAVHLEDLAQFDEFYRQIEAEGPLN